VFTLSNPGKVEDEDAEVGEAREEDFDDMIFLSKKKQTAANREE
jgi:hypothetical protein